MLKLLLAVTAVTSLLATLATGAVAQKVPPEIPQAIICWNEQTKTWRVGNLSTINEDGTATYIAPSGHLANTVNAKGVVEPPIGRASRLDCYGKTLDQLRALGRVVDFQRAR